MVAPAQVIVPDHHVPELPDGWWYAAKRRLLGPPLVTEQLSSQRLSKPLALGVLSCDGLSSAAYGTEEIRSRVPSAAATIIPFDVQHKVETLKARRARADGLSEYEWPVPPSGTDSIGSLRQPGPATVQGRLRAAQVRPVRDNNVLACEVADSTGELTALLYGRTHITGVEPGRRIRLQGMVGIGDDGHPAMVNPACELLG